MIMTNSEMLELAAKAAGINGQWSDYHQAICYSIKGSLDMHVWRPQADDGDSKRLAVKLRISVEFVDGGFLATHEDSAARHFAAFTCYGGDADKAWRYAVLNVAAQIGALMP